MKGKDAVFAEVKKIPAGKVTTYKKISQVSGLPPVFVGQILKKNTDPSTPCHRVVRSDGSLGGYFGGGRENEEKKRRVLKKEGILFENGKVKSDFFV